MKKILFLSLALAIPAFGGTTSKEVIAPAPAPEPCLFTWFVGGSVGYLTELEEPMYNLHVGTDTCWNIGGWNVAMFAEIGYTEKDEDWGHTRRDQYERGGAPKIGSSDSFTLDELEDALSSSYLRRWGSTSYDLEIMPITFNFKLERPLTGNLNAYFGGGLGMARVDLDMNFGYDNFSDDDWVFTGQLFAGLNYNVTSNFEVYGGVRWIYYDDADLSDHGDSGTLEMDDDWLLELGMRYNF